MGVFQQPLCCCRCCRCCCCCWLWFTGLTLQCCWWRWGCWVYFNNRCGFLALQSYESCLVLRRSRLSCVNKRFISGSSWAWWRWWCWWLEGLCVSLCRVNILRSIPFVMSGHLIFNFFQTLGLPIFNTNPNNGCPKRIDQHSGQAHKHFSHRFHGVSFWADVQTWRSKQKFVF